ncbi:MAG: hypothetical protein ACI4C1_06735 [Lachnospiraceae bacterium]
MRKFTAIILTAAMVMSLTACGGDNGQKDTTASTTTEAVEDTTEGTTESVSDSTTEEVGQGGSEDGEITNALDLLNSIWATYADDEKFPAAGGDFNEENMSMEGPGNFSVENEADVFDASLAIPADAIELFDNAASLTHMMNVNTFTSAAFHLKDASTASNFADLFKESIAQRQWMCGFPEKMFVINVGEYVISGFGHNEIVDLFMEKVATVYPESTVLSEEPIE